MTDKVGYANLLAEKFDYTNTHYDRDPRFDFTESHPQLAGTYDFILSADVLEHIAPPVERALEETCRLLKPHGFLGVTVYCNPSDQMREHFPELHDYRVVPLGGAAVLVNRRLDGSIEVREELVFHGGSGATLEMREFGATALRAKLRASGFREVYFLTDNVPEIGIFFDGDVSQPLIARKEPFALTAAARTQMIDLWRSEEARADALANQIHSASQSKWLRIGKKLGFGPKFD
jgi:SAM-dependent methyltransferase